MKEIDVQTSIITRKIEKFQKKDFRAFKLKIRKREIHKGSLYIQPEVPSELLKEV